MCFSATASFAVGAALTPAGVYCVRSAFTKDIRYLPLALTPLAFAAQQVAEGVVWVGLGREDPAWSTPASLVYLFFALSFWPVWIPLSAAFLEQRRFAQAILAVCLLAGLCWTWFLFVPIALDPDRWLTTEVVHCSIRYSSADLPMISVLGEDLMYVLYFIPIFLALGVSAKEPVPVFAILLLVLAVISHLVFAYAFVSVWCFFAAVLSLGLCHVFFTLPPRQPLEPRP